MKSQSRILICLRTGDSLSRELLHLCACGDHPHALRVDDEYTPLDLARGLVVGLHSRADHVVHDLWKKDNNSVKYMSNRIILAK